MGKSIFRRPKRVNIRRPLPPPPSDDGQIPKGVPKKPKLAVTGTRTDRLCSICLGRLEPGSAITFCECGRFFHLDCITELETCPLCGHTFAVEYIDADPAPDAQELEGDHAGEDIMEIVYQCPACDAYVPEDARNCVCGAVFETEEWEEIFICPGCGCELDESCARCEACGMIFD